MFHPGNPHPWDTLLGGSSRLTTLDEAFLEPNQGSTVGRTPRRAFPFLNTARMVWDNPRLIVPGLKLSAEIAGAYASTLFTTPPLLLLLGSLLHSRSCPLYLLP